MTNRTIVMTGATSGIGAHALSHLAAPDTCILIGARGASTSRLPGVETLPLDLASLESVRGFADSVLARLDGTKVDALVLNAGTQSTGTEHASADGYEMTFAVNHLAHYLLARLLAPSVSDGGRIILTTSDTHDPRHFPGAPKTLDLDGWITPGGSRGAAYPASKLGNLLTAESLARQAEIHTRHITVIGFNPGLTGGTGLSRSAPAAVRTLFQALRPVFRALSVFRPSLYMGTPEVAGTALARLANGTTTPPADRVYASLVRGKLEYPDPSNLALSPAAQSEMWQRSAQLVGLPEN